ncbi:uncharacterized protein tbc1d10c [Garra rufa]|uniref:uncharacterized protein tbc1d10c n=1 Tax=Garra rufa TaxID=137080 RepID=UPI003CCEA5B8
MSCCRQGLLEQGGGCVDGVNPCSTLTHTDHTAELHPRPDQTPVGIGERGGQERKEKGGDKSKKKRQKKRRFRRFASFFCLPRPKSTKAQGEQVEQIEEDQGSTDDQTSIQDIVCSVDNDHQDTPPSAPEIPTTTNDQQMEDVPPLDQSGGYASAEEVVVCDVDGKFPTGQPDHPSPVPAEVVLTVMVNQGPHCRHIIELLDWRDKADQAPQRQPGPKDPIRAASEINVNATLNTAAPGPAEVSEVRVLGTTDVTRQDARHVDHKGSPIDGKEHKEVPVKAALIFVVVASARAGVQGCFSPRAPLSTSLVPEVPAKAALMSVNPDHSKDEEETHGPEVTVVETNRFGFILGNGETDSDGPCPELVRHRESKWLSLMSQWEQVMEKKSNKVKGQCQKGIPASLRAKGWPLLCGAKNRKEKNSELYKRLAEAPDHQGWTDIIKRDTDRQFPFHEMFQSKDGHGQKDLLEVLKAYTQHRPDEGYCQAQGPVAAVLLMNMPAEEAFWCLVQISELYLPGYYSPLLEGVLFDAAVLSSILKKLCPAAHKHLQNQGVEPLMFATDWLMCLYSRHLPFDTLLRVWDLFFCYGVRVLFQVAVVLVRRCLGEGRLRKECDGQMETLERLRGVKQCVQHEQTDAFIHEVCSVSLSLADLQKQTEKELEKWKKDKPNSTFDPRERCHGHRMVWERAQDKPKEQEKKERPKGSLTLPLMRSHSSLSPSVLRKKWRKRSSKTDTEEWDGGGRKFSRSLMEESDDEEVRRRSVCGIVGEQRAKRDRLADEFCAHKDHNAHPNISVVVSSSMECDVFEKEPTETSLNQRKDNSETTRRDEEERTAGVVVCVVEESIQTHHHIQQHTNQDAQSTEMQGLNQVEQNKEKDREKDERSTDAPIKPNEQNTDKQTCRDEQTVETERTLESCEGSTLAETSQEDDIQTDSSKQEEEIKPDNNIQEEAETEEDRLPNTIRTGENEKNIPEIQINVVQEEERSQTSHNQHEKHEHSESQTDLFVSIAVEKNEEKGIQQKFDVLPEETTDPQISDSLKRLEDDKQDKSLDENDSYSHRGGKETLQPPEIVLTLPSLKTEQESETEHLHGPANPDEEFQSGNQKHKDMDATVTSRELEHCPIDSTAVGSGNPEQCKVDSADDTIILEPQEVVLTQSVETCIKEISQITPKNSEVDQSSESENTVCCEVSATDESNNLTESFKDDACRSVHLESNEMHAAPGSENLECNTIDITAESGKLESSGVDIAPESGNPESSKMPVTSESGNPECSITDVTSETEKPVSSGMYIAVDNPECNDLQVTTGSGNEESDTVDITVGSGNSESNTVGNPKCNDMQVTTVSGNAENNIVDSTDGSCNPDHKEVHVTTASDNSETTSEHVISGSGNPECNNVPSTSESGKPENNIADSAVGSGNPAHKEVHVTTELDNLETNRENVTTGSGNPECNEVPSTSEPGKPENNIADSAVGSGNPDHKEVHVTTVSDNSENTREHVASGSGNPECNKVPSTSEPGKPENNITDYAAGSGNPDYKGNVTTGSDNSENVRELVTAGSGNPECKKEDCAAGSGNPHNSECAIPGNSQELESSKSSKSSNPNVPPAHLRVRRSSSARVSYPTILSEDTFKEPQQQENTHSEQTSTLTQDTQAQPNSPTKSGAPKRLGLFRRLRGETNKTPVPKILIQDFSEKEDRLTSKERRRRKREKERKEKEEKDRKKREKELEKDKEKERKKPQTRGKSFQVLNRKGVDNAMPPENSDSQKTHTRRNSAPFSDGYF